MQSDKLRAFADKYLPSKRFAWVIGGVTLGIIILIGISNYLGYHRVFNAKPPVSSNGTLTDVVSRDSNNNGIPDWEESLYGLDPTADGTTNKNIIDAKQAATDTTPSDDTATTTPTDAFSQQLLSTILALHQSGTLTPDVITNIAASIGDSVDSKHTTATTYTMNDIKISTLGPDAAKAAYRTALKKVVDQYSAVGLGSENTIIADGLNAGTADSLTGLAPIAAAYTSMSKQIIALPTPSAVAQNALDLANSSAQMGAALMQVETIYSDALTGMIGISDYTSASTLSDAATATLSAYFSN